MKKLWRNNHKILKFVFLVFICWEALITFLDFICPYTGIPQHGGFNYVEIKVINPSFLWNRANFDGIHYLDIAKKGYGIYQQAFFPLYSKLIRFFTPVFGKKDLLAALFVSNFSTLLALWLFYRVVLLDYPDSVARESLLIWLFFPTSFFLFSAYTEGLFIFLILLSFYAARKKKWLLAGISGALASNTRLVGIFLFPALLWEWWQNKKITNYKLQITNLLSIFLIPLGLISYMKFLWERYHDPLMFLHVQPFFGAQRSGGKIILIYQVFWRYLKMILTTKWDPLYFVVWMELIVGFGFLILLFLAYKKRIRISYLIFAFLAYLAPTFSGSFSSLPRYVLVLFPCFIYLGLIESRLIRDTLLFIFGFLFVFSLVLFFRGYWIA